MNDRVRAQTRAHDGGWYNALVKLARQPLRTDTTGRNQSSESRAEESPGSTG